MAPSPFRTRTPVGFILLLAIGVTLHASACGGGGSAEGPNRGGGVGSTQVILLSVSISPANPAIPMGATQQFTATGTFSKPDEGELTLPRLGLISQGVLLWCGLDFNPSASEQRSARNRMLQ